VTKPNVQEKNQPRNNTVRITLMLMVLIIIIIIIIIRSSIRVVVHKHYEQQLVCSIHASIGPP
jgi:hypothetical protein